MLKTPLSEQNACRRELQTLTEAGCELVRAAFPDRDLKGALADLVASSSIPVMADIHFDYRLALAALEAGCPAIRVNPGNMGGANGLREVVAAAKDHGAVIRIGANSGSLNSDQIAQAQGDYGKALFEAVCAQAEMLREQDFHDMILSAKSTSVPETVRANRMLRDEYPYPLHVGITEAGPGIEGNIRSAVGIGLLLGQGCGDTLRVSLTGPPVDEVRAGYAILRALEIRDRGGRIVSCPTCGRRKLDVQKIARDIEPLLPRLPDGFTVAVMGCEVNGPREARHADLGVAGSPNGAIIFRRGEVLRECRVDQIIPLLEEMILGGDSASDPREISE
jgi:(E)-4-hydroxy-3-methylbut-2-enyl-diphosphate synthase